MTLGTQVIVLSGRTFGTSNLLFAARVFAARGRRFLIPGLLAAVFVTMSLGASGQTFKTLYSFKAGADGNGPGGALVMDAAGNLYGTTESGGVGACENGCGTVFKLTPSGVETVLHSFGSVPDGAIPEGPMAMDSDGNLYGATAAGGSASCQIFGSAGCGTIFKVTPAGQETVLYSFVDGSDGAWPIGGVIMDSSGNLYGTTTDGGTEGGSFGTIFKLNASGEESVLYRFPNTKGRGMEPDSTLLLDSKGRLYGTTPLGGLPHGSGVLFRLSATGVETLPIEFKGSNGIEPLRDRLIMDAAGNLYGTTAGATTAGTCGTVFELTPGGVETLLHTFSCTNDDGNSPVGGVVQDAQGNLYGATWLGGKYGYSGPQCDYAGCGTVFKVTPTGVETILHSFCKATDCTDGMLPFADLIIDQKGSLYGTTTSGGKYGYGSVFKLTP